MNRTILEISRWALVVLALVFLISLGAGSRTSDADPAAVLKAVTAELDLTKTLPAENQMVKRLYGLQPSDYEACYLYYPETNMDAEELLLVKLSDVDQQETVRAAVEKRLQTQKTSFDGYGIEQFDLLTNYAVVEVRGNWVLFVVSKTSEAARKAFLGAL